MIRDNSSLPPLKRCITWHAHGQRWEIRFLDTLLGRGQARVALGRWAEDLDLDFDWEDAEEVSELIYGKQFTNETPA